MQNGENSEGVTKGTVDDVPELKAPLRAAEEGDALRERGLRLCQQDGALKFLVAGGEQTEPGELVIENEYLDKKDEVFSM